MNTPLWILDHARTCKHSYIAADAKDFKPDYKCSLTDKECKLIFAGECNIREGWPENHSSRVDGKPS